MNTELSIRQLELLAKIAQSRYGRDAYVEFVGKDEIILKHDEEGYPPLEVVWEGDGWELRPYEE